MALKAYHLKTWRVSGLTKKNKSIMEIIVVKLVGEISFEKFCKLIPNKGFDEDYPPKIIKVLSKEGAGSNWKELGEESIIEAQERVIKLSDISIGTKKIDYKSEFEGQKKTINALEERLKALENKPKPGPKKKETPKPKGNE